MNEGTGRSAVCPDPELLAAFVDGRLARGERAAIERHLAECDACREVLAETVRLTGDASGRVVHGRFGRRAVAVGGGALALAASLLLVVWMQPGLLRFGAPTPYEELVAAVGTNRTIEGRLTGGFQYGPLRSPTRGSVDLFRDNYQVLAAAARIRNAAYASATSQNQHALGAVQLVLGEYNAAVTTLETAAAEEPSNARFQNDVAAAYLTRAARLDRPEDYPRALSAAERAVRLDPELDEALFNRAVALEALSLREQAIEAWRAVLERDPESGWAAEARQRLQRLEAVSDGWSSRRPAFQAAVEQADRRAIAALVTAFPERTRDYFDDELLPAWGDARARGESVRATRLLHGCDGVAAALQTLSGDAMPADACSAMRAFAARADPADLVLPDALVTLGMARGVYEEGRVSDAAGQFRSARLRLEAHGHPYAAWCRLHGIIAAYYAGRYDEVDRDATRLAAHATSSRYWRLLARAEWMRGLAATMRGRFDAAVDRYAAALGAFERLREDLNAASLRSLLAETLLYLGDDSSMWRERTAALNRLSGDMPPRRAHTILVGAANASLQAGLPDAAFVFADSALRAAVSATFDAGVFEAYVHRARAAARAGRAEAAAADLERARGHLRAFNDSNLRRRAEAELMQSVTEAAGGRPADVEAALTRSVEYFAGLGTRVRLPPLYLARARVRAPRDVAAARQDLETGIELFEAESRRLSAADSARVFHFDEIWPLYAELANVIVDDAPASALAVVERGRRVAWRDWTPVEWARSGRLPVPDEGTLVVNFIALEDELLAWRMERDVRAFRSRVPRRVLRSLVEAFRQALQTGDPRWRTLSERLYDLTLGNVDLPAAGRLVIVADDALSLVPFAALRNPGTGRLLVEDFEVVSAPNLRITPAADWTPRSVLVVSPTVSRMPALPAARAEAREVAAMFPHSRWLDAARATKAGFSGAADQADLVHFAGHAVENREFPYLGQLLLNGAHGDDALYAHEILEMEFGHTRLVVLAACSTAGASGRPGAGALGLASAFLSAGVPTVAATLWNVDDRAAHGWFTEFHAGIARGLRPAAAWRAMALESIAGGEPAPGFWAAVQVITRERSSDAYH